VRKDGSAVLRSLGTLADWKVNGRLEALAWAGRKALCRELCDGLHFLHARASVVHRDLKVGAAGLATRLRSLAQRFSLRVPMYIRTLNLAHDLGQPCVALFSLKPENVLFKSETSRRGHCVTLKIADFGLSRPINHSRSRRDTSSGGVGTDCWMPPEGLQGRCGDTASLTFSYDVHPAGSLLYYVLCAGAHSRGRCCHHAPLNLFAAVTTLHPACLLS
jgi:serine/threonine protein kinase